MTTHTPSQKARLVGLALHQGIQSLLQRAPWLSYHFSKPTFVTLMLNEACNLRCQQCNFWQFREMGMPTESVMRALKKLRAWLGPFHLTLSGGEPLLRHDIPEITREAKRLGAIVNITTNGTLLTENVVGLLSAAHLDMLTMSIDGASAGTHDRLRGLDGTYEKAVRNLRRARKRLHIRIATILFKENLAEAGDIVRWVENEKLAGVIFQPVLMNFTDKPSPDSFPFHLLPDNPSAVTRAIEVLISMKGKGSPINNSIGHLRLMEAYLRDPLAPLGNFPSSAGIGSIIVLPDGGIDLGKREPILNIHSCKNLGRAWASNEIIALRREMNQRRSADALCNCIYERTFREKTRVFLKNYWG